MKIKLDQSIIRKSFHGTGWIADILILLFALYTFFSGNGKQTSILINPKDPSEQFLIVISVIPWYLGYLLHHFEIFPKILRRLLQWTTALITLAMIVFLIIFLFPLIDQDQNDPYSIFLISFGSFMMVLGPMMMMSGYLDAPFIDQNSTTSYSKNWPVVTFTMLLITLAILFMILIIGYFDPTWQGNASFGVVMLGYLGGPLLAILVAVPFILIATYLEKIDRHKIIPSLFRYGIPAICFFYLLKWNDLILSKFIVDFGFGHFKPSYAFLTLIISGIIPFRILILIKPPFSLLSLIIGITSIGLYYFGIISSFR